MDVKEMTAGLQRIVEKIYQEQKILGYGELVPEKTALVVVDMVKGFVSEGLLKSQRVEALTPKISDIMRSCKSLGIPIIAFADCHSENSPEFEVYGPHCQAGTCESEVVEELQAVGGYYLITKNSSNGFLEPKLQDWLKSNPQVTDFVVVGDCTDICILQFCLTLKAYFNMLNLKSRVIVPVNAVDTFDFDLHHGDLTHVMALYNMAQNGIEIIGGFER